jgi:hypothetical protein
VSYLELQKQVVDKLRELGVYYEYDSRLAVFWLRHNVPKLYPGASDILPLLDALVRMRNDGLEPPSVNGKYT